MKKLLVLSLVFAVAGLANAGFVVKYADGAEGVAPGETFRVEWYADGWLGGLTVRHLTDGAIPSGAISNVFLHSGLTLSRQIRDLVNDGAGNLVYRASGTAIGGATPLGGGADTRIAPGSLVLAFDITTSADVAPGDYMLDFVFGTWNNHGADNAAAFTTAQLGRVAYTVVPEPMTMGLLGLGALFLRRRK